jgi:histidinol-phosphate aminotransferase
MNEKQVESFLERGFNRRQIGRMATLFAGAALPLEFAMAQQAEQQLRARMAGGRSQVDFADPSIVRINQNENAQGPCAEGLEAMSKVAPRGWRYNPNNDQSEIVSVVAAQEGVKPENIQFYAGSSDPLQRIGCCFTGPNRSWTMAGPGYGNGTPDYIGAKTVKIPLAADYSHDVEAMIKREPNAGVYYVCNPNNPSGTLTSREKVQYLLDHKQKDGVILVDEAYIHFSANAKSCADMVAAGKDIIVMRTFSKIYGMAGLRVGYVMGRPDLVARLRQFGPGFLPVTGIACALASLKSKTLVPERRAQMKQIRESTYAFLYKKGIKYVPSEVNFFMMETNKPGADIAAKYAEKKIIIGRVWQEWPTHVRITIGNKEEMDKFTAATAEIFS